MKTTMMMMRLLSELLKDSSRSDRDLAKVLGISQPSVSRMRNKLVEDGLIQEFAVIPDLAKIGFELLAISCVKTKVTKELLEKAEKWMNKYPNVIFVAQAEGMGKNGVMLSLHRNYTSYSNFVTEGRLYWGDAVEEYDTLLVSLKGLFVKPFSSKYLAKLIETPEEQL